MPDYQKGKIYKLWSPQGEENEIYIGSTCDELHKRKSSHKCLKKCKSKILFEKYDDVRIELIEDYPCNSKGELLKKEGEYIRANKCLNIKIPCRTQKEYYKEWSEKNKQKIAEYQKEYRDKHHVYCWSKIINYIYLGKKLI
jgi:hypothetical protein